MQIRELTIRHFRGVKELNWRPSDPLVCLLGRGDSGKSTILDAIEAALTPKQPWFSDIDFFHGDVSTNLEILVTVGELSEHALNEKRFGLHTRGWTKDGALRDEPEEDDEPVVTVRLVVDASLEGEWTLHTDRHEPKVLSPRDRALFGVVRLGSDIERHLTWARGSALSALTEEREGAASNLALAFRAARELVTPDKLPSLAAVTDVLTTDARQLGAYCATSYGPGLDTQRGAMSLGGIALHDGRVPVRLAGLGTRRLVSLAIQRRSVPSGAIVLIDEIEHGLEPHRIRYALKVLRDAVSPAKPALGVAAQDTAALPTGQIFLTTHSQTTLVELSCRHIAVCRRVAGVLSVRTPGDALQALLRRVPESLLSSRVLVCEGPTEIGLVRGLRNTWNHDRPFPFEALGTWLADGNGSQGVDTAVELASLGYAVALFRDADNPLTPGERAKLHAGGVSLFEWADSLATEERIFRDVGPAALQLVLNLAFETKSAQSVLQKIAAQLGVASLPGPTYGDWLSSGKTDLEMRSAIGRAAKGKGDDQKDRGWFKNTTYGELLGALVGAEVRRNPSTPLATTLMEVERWMYAH